MRYLSTFLLSICCMAMLISCEGAVGDHSSTDTGASTKVLAEELSNDILEAFEDNFEIVLRDSVNWYVMLNQVEVDNNLIRYKGILYYIYGGREIQGEAKAVYNSNPDVLTIQCEDPYDETDPDIMAYGFVFDSASSRHLRGGWAYLKAKWQGGTAGRLIKGTIGTHVAEE